MHFCEASTSWSRSYVRFVSHSGDERKEVYIEISNPGDVDYIRDQLNKIVEGWHKQLGSLSN